MIKPRMRVRTVRLPTDTLVPVSLMSPRSFVLMEVSGESTRGGSIEGSGGRTLGEKSELRVLLSGISATARSVWPLVLTRLDSWIIHSCNSECSASSSRCRLKSRLFAEAICQRSPDLVGSPRLTCPHCPTTAFRCDESKAPEGEVNNPSILS